MSSLQQQQYQPAAFSLQKDFGKETKYAFDSPSTIADRQVLNQQQQFQPFVQAGGSGFNIPPPPPLPQRGLRKQHHPLRLRTRNWQNNNLNWSQSSQPFFQGISPYGGSSSWSTSTASSAPTTQYSNFANSQQNHNIPIPPPLPGRIAQRKWKSGPYKQRRLRTRDWGSRSSNGWSNWSLNNYNSHTQTLDSNRSSWLHSAWLEERGLNQQQRGIQEQQFLPQSGFQQQQQFLPQSGFQQTQYSNSNTTISSVPLAPAAALAPLATGRKGRRQRKHLAKQNAVAQTLQARMAPPIGDPAVNHYRRGAPATVPIIGAPTVASGAGVHGRKLGRRHNRGRRATRGANVLPVVAPIGTHAAQPQVAPTFYRHTTQQGAGLAQPISSQPLAPSAGIPLSTGFSQMNLGSQPVSQPLYSSALPAYSTINTGLAGQPLYSNAPNHSIFTKHEQIIQPAARPIGSATF